METSEDELIGKIVMSGEGRIIGIIKDSLVDNHTGKSTSILVKPSKEIDIGKYKQNKQGSIILPFDCITPVQDVIIIEKEPLYENS